MAFDVKITQPDGRGGMSLVDIVTFEDYMKREAPVVDSLRRLLNRLTDDDSVFIRVQQSDYHYIQHRPDRNRINPWQAYPPQGGRSKYFGCFKTKLDAVQAVAGLLGCAVEDLKKHSKKPEAPRQLSPYRYVTHEPRARWNPWKTQKKINKRVVSFGSFPNPYQAAQAVAKHLGCTVEDLEKK